MSLQEKFQITVPYTKKDENKGDEEWCDVNSARKPGTLGHSPKNNKTVEEMVVFKTNMLPPGMEIANQGGIELDHFAFDLAGTTDVAQDTNLSSLRDGFTRRQMKGTDDQYTGEHMDHFYGEAVGDDGNPGFVERNNYLDRE